MEINNDNGFTERIYYRSILSGDNTLAIRTNILPGKNSILGKIFEKFYYIDFNDGKYIMEIGKKIHISSDIDINDVIKAIK